MTDHEKKLLHDILSAADRILLKTLGKSQTIYEADADLQLMVERLFTILGEAAGRLQRHFPDTAAKLPDLRGPIAFRNFLIHVYDAVEPRRCGRSLRKICPPCALPSLCSCHPD
jgi:uncharacterized protein with HEPN domain